ncbi:MAG: aminoglycoside phosphotransferase family protein [Gammaproteobacteria bacterium]|nr:aminoglycoside phosphotransferase family protein [Gammaproteobacteria bacterium]
MQYSLNHSQSDAEQINKLKKILACDNIQTLTKSGGGNSVVFCVEADGKKWAVKSYPPYAPAQRDRLAAELEVYQFLNHQHVPAVPLLKTYSETERWLVMSWIDGVVPRDDYSESDIDQALQFIRDIARLNSLPEAAHLPLAAEACLSLNVLLSQIERRLENLIALSENEPDLNKFLMKDYYPVFKKFKQQAIDGYVENDVCPDSELPLAKRSLIPADFGFHNTIRDSSGKLYFFDFDYFGWDDPVKLLADILWHPKMILTLQQNEKFIQGLSEIYNTDQFFLSRFYYTLPLFGLRWALILLNEFVPHFWLNRQYANVHQNQAEAKQTQLKRAKELLTYVQQLR